MRLNNVKTLFNISDELLMAFNKVSTKQSAYLVLENKRLEDIFKIDFNFDLEFLKQLNDILNTVLTITRKHYLTTKNNEVILRSSLISTFDNQSFEKTLKDSKLWSKKDFKMTPEYAYSYEIDDDLNTYENRVVMTCLNRMELLIKNYSYYYNSKILTLNNTSNENDYTYSSKFYKSNKMLVSNLLTNKELFFAKLNEFIDKLNDKMKRIRNSRFYLALKHFKPVTGKIMLTNIFKDNRQYNKIYRFMNKTNEMVDIKKGQDSLINYTLLLLFKSLGRQGYLYIDDYPKSKYHPFNKDIVAGDAIFSFKNDQFIVSIGFNNNVLGYEIYVRNIKNLYDYSKTLFIPYYSISQLQEINIDLSNIDTSSYNNIVIFGYDFIKKYQDGQFKEIKISPFQKDFELICVFIESLTYTIEALKSIYVKTCPICGEKEIMDNHDDYSCLNCQRHYSFIKDNTIWLKSIV